MGLNTLTNRSAGQTILDTFFNDIHQAINSDFVGRNSAGVPTSGQSLGTTAIPWGAVRAASLVLNGDPIDASQITSPPNRVISGKTRSTSNQPAFITPTGSAASFTIFASTTNLLLDVNGTQVTVATDIVKTGLTLAPSTQNTAAVNDADAASQEDTRIWGEEGHRKSITITSAGTNITSAVGTFRDFKIGSEYFRAFVESTTKLSKIYRGNFYDSSLAPINRSTFTNSATITLMKTGWVFVEDNGTTVDVSYNNPTWAYSAPSSPVSGDYWYDLANDVWKRYDGATFQIIDRTLVGSVVLDATNCVAARCEEFFSNFSDENTLDIEVNSTEISKGVKPDSRVSVLGNLLRFGKTLPTWNITTNLAIAADMINATEQASTIYYLYLADTGQTYMSDIRPHRRANLRGEYHPHNPWRCVGTAYNDGSSNITNAESRFKFTSSLILSTGNGYGATNTRIRRYSAQISNVGTSVIYAESSASGASFTVTEPGKYALLSSDKRSAATLEFGISKNSTQLTTDISGITTTNVLALTATVSGTFNTIDTVVDLQIGDIIRPHQDGSANDTSGLTKFAMLRVA